jgi:serine/threonine protein kinase
MTRCGTPCWTAPEIISDSLKHSEKADVYRFGLNNLPFVFWDLCQFGAPTNARSGNSFSIVMWEVLTRETPYHNKNMTTVAMDVISGERPPVPVDCPKTYADLMERAWNGKPSKRPDMEEIIMFLNAEADGVNA